MHKCTFHDGITIKPDGVHELEACHYQEVERWENVTVSVRRCKYCGNIDISWFKQEDTVKVDLNEYND